MKICVWFRTIEGPWGGGNQFLKALRQELLARGHQVTEWPRGDEDVVLINAFNAGAGRWLYPAEVADVRRQGKWRWFSRVLPAAMSKMLPRKGPVLVHRLDGHGEAVRGVRSKIDDLQPAINGLCDSTIFQSEYCRRSFAEHGVIPPVSTVIYNGVDGTIFYPAADRRPSRRLVFVASSWSSNPRKGFATLAALSEIEDVDVRFAGRWPQSIPSKKVHQLGALNSADLAVALRQADVMVHAAMNEPCSNAVLEAMASGLPVLYLDSGGTGELARSYGVAMTGNLHADVTQVRDQYKELRESVMSDRPRFLIPDAARRYLDHFESMLEVRHKAPTR